MKFVFGYPLDAPPNLKLLTPQATPEIAKAIEVAGFEAAAFTEHPIPTSKWRETGGHDALDPFVALSFVAAATQNLRLLTNLTVLPYRNPFLLAKTVSSLDVLSGGRLILGMGTGYLKGEYFALGVDFDERNELFDEAIEVMSKTFSGESISHEGKHFSAKEVASLPIPVQQPHPPFWLGGNSKLTRRRVAEWGQGWMPMPNPKELAGRRRSAHLETNQDLIEMISYMKNHAEEVGRKEPIDIIYMTFEGGIPGSKDFELQKHLDSIAELADVGVNYLVTAVSGKEVAQVKENVEFMGREIVAVFSS